jgi:NADPH:quinone reductase-like Zn-dependent oxidoreductase
VLAFPGIFRGALDVPRHRDHRGHEARRRRGHRRDGWTTVTVKAASLNHHDLWSLRGVGLKEEQLPMILGCDAAGYDEDGNEVVVHAVISDPDWVGDETLDPKRSLLSERTRARSPTRCVPRRNVVPKPAS